MSWSSELTGLIEQCGVSPDQLGLGLERNKVKATLAEIRAAIDPQKFADRLNLREPIPRNTWIRWCDIEGVKSGLAFYEQEDVRRLVRVCVWFAKGGNQADLEAIIIREEEKDAYQNAA